MPDLCKAKLFYQKFLNNFSQEQKDRKRMWTGKIIIIEMALWFED